MTEIAEYVLDRDFDAPRKLVWRAWTDPELLQQWYGPGVETTVHRFDLQPGGSWRNEMKWGSNSDFQLVVFQEVVEPEKIVWHHSSADAEWNIISNPRMPDWPSVLLTTVTFDALGARTHVRLSQLPLNATDAEIACFAEAMAGMDQGWASGFTLMEKLLAELQADT